MAVIDGIILSKIRYNLGIIGNLWISSKYCDTQQRFVTFTKQDMNRLQTIMNKALKLAVKPAEKNYPTESLLNNTDKLSIHQEVAFQIGINTKKIIETGKPEYLSQFFKKSGKRNTRKQTYETNWTRKQITQESFCNTGKGKSLT